MSTLSLSGPITGLVIAITPDAEQQKADALDLCRPIVEVKTATQQADCLAAAGLSKSILKALETSREEVKRPVLDAGRKIDSTAKTFASPLAAEILRLENLASAYQVRVNAEAAKVKRAEEARQQAERDTAMHDSESEQRYLNEKSDEHDARRREDVKRIQNASDEGREEAQRIADEHAMDDAEEMREIQRSIDQAKERREDEMRQRAVSMAVVSAKPKAAGASVLVSYDYEVVSISDLYKARPDLCRIEECRALILSVIANGQQIPGLRIFEETRVRAKS